MVSDCVHVVEEYRAEHPDVADPIGTLAVGGEIPNVDDARKTHEEYEEPFPAQPRATGEESAFGRDDFQSRRSGEQSTSSGDCEVSRRAHR